MPFFELRNNVKGSSTYILSKLCFAMNFEQKILVHRADERLICCKVSIYI